MLASPDIPGSFEIVSINFPQPPVMLKRLALRRQLCSLLRLSHCLPEYDSPFILLALFRTFSVLQVTNVHQVREVDGFSVLLLLTRDFRLKRDFLFVLRWVRASGHFHNFMNRD